MRKAGLMISRLEMNCIRRRPDGESLLPGGEGGLGLHCAHQRWPLGQGMDGHGTEMGIRGWMYKTS